MSWIYRLECSAPHELSFAAATPQRPGHTNWVLRDSPDTDLMSTNGTMIVLDGGVYEWTLVLDQEAIGAPSAGKVAFVVKLLSGVTYTLPSIVIPAPTVDQTGAPTMITHRLQMAPGDSVCAQLQFDSAFTLNMDANTSRSFISVQNVTFERKVMVYSSMQNSPPLTIQSTPKFFFTKATTINSTGKLTFYLTDNGTATGNAIFPNGYNPVFNAAGPTSRTINAAISASEDSRSADNKSIVANVVSGNTVGVLLGGTISGLVAAPVGSVVSLTAFGY